MHTAFFALIVLTSTSLHAQQFNYLKPEEQKYFKNDSMDGKNQQERIDMNVREINRLYGEVAALKGEVLKLRNELDELKNKK